MKPKVLILSIVLLLSFGCFNNNDLSQGDNATETEVKLLTGVGKIVGYSKCHDAEKNSTFLGILIITEANDSLLTFNIPFSFFDLDSNQLEYGVYNIDGGYVSFSYKKAEDSEIRYDFLCLQTMMDLGFLYPVENFSQIIIEQISYNVKDCCKFENPLTDLPWLKEIVDGWEAESVAGNPPHARIYQCTYRDGIGFLLEPCVGCADFGYELTNCDGELLCIMWGFAGNPCTEFNVDFENKTFIYEIKPN